MKETGQVLGCLSAVLMDIFAGVGGQSSSDGIRFCAESGCGSPGISLPRVNQFRLLAAAID